MNCEPTTASSAHCSNGRNNAAGRTSTCKVNCWTMLSVKRSNRGGAESQRWASPEHAAVHWPERNCICPRSGSRRPTPTEGRSVAFRRTLECRRSQNWPGRRLNACKPRGTLPFQWVLFDEHFGQNPGLLTHIHKAGLYFFAEIPHSTCAWLRCPRTHIPKWRSKRGPAPTRQRLMPGQPKAQRVDALALTLRCKQWHRVIIKEGTKGPQTVEVAVVRAVMVEDRLPGRTEWLVFRRDLEPGAELKVYRSNAPVKTPRKVLARRTDQRWPVESAITECKGEVGMDHYEVRGWLGWHHHMTTSFLAHHFLVHLRIQLKKSTGPNGGSGTPTAQRGVTQAPV